jgi:hypothetical protein
MSPRLRRTGLSASLCSGDARRPPNPSASGHPVTEPAPGRGGLGSRPGRVTFRVLDPDELKGARHHRWWPTLTPAPTHPS